MNSLILQPKRFVRVTLCCLILMASITTAQAQTIAGTVRSATDNQPLPGVTVHVSTSNKGTVTDNQGHYQLLGVSPNDTLVFSFIGYQEVLRKIGSNKSINVSLIATSASLDQLVVIGYGEEKKINLTGAVDVVSSKELQNRPATNVGTLLQGLSPNLNLSITRNNGGQPGHGMSWNIRGTGSLSGNDAPLVLVDGVEMDPSNLDPNSIQSVSILKDAAASAIYGSRAPFGVVLITTKKGSKDNKLTVTYNANFDIKQPIYVPHWQSSLRFATAMNEAATNSGEAPIYGEDQMERIKGYIAGTYLPEYDTANPPPRFASGRHVGNANRDYFDILFKKQIFSQKHSLSLKGGNEKFQYYTMGGYSYDNGSYNFIHDFYKRYNILSNLNYQPTKWIRINLNTKFAKSQLKTPNGAFGLNKYQTLHEFTKMWPMAPMYVWSDSAKNHRGDERNPNVNALKGAGLDNLIENNLLITFGTELEPVKDWKTNFMYTYKSNDNEYTRHLHRVTTLSFSGAPGNIGAPVSSYYQNWGREKYTTLSLTTSYEKHLNGHFLKGMVGYEQEMKHNYSLEGKGANLITNDVPSIQTAFGPFTVNDALSQWSTQALFARINYNFKNKYLAEIDGRYNGSSRFAEGSRWGFFPSFSVGYNISEEKFWNPIKRTFNHLKLRMSYGSLGNQNVPNYLYLPIMPVHSNLEWILNNTRPNYAGIPGIISPSLTWEKINMLDFGIDANLLDYRLSLTFDWYNRNTSRMFGPAQSLPSVLGTNPPKENNASLSTKGYEVSLGWNDKVATGISYHVKITLSHYMSTVTKYYNPLGLIDNFYKGKKLGEIWGYTTDGLIQSKSEKIPDQSKFWPTWGPGDIEYSDLDGNGVINDGKRTLDDYGDLSIIGNSTPLYEYGINAGFNWKDFNFNMFWQGRGRTDLWIPTSNFNRVFWSVEVGSEGTLFKGQKDFWRPADDNTVLGPNINGYFPKPYTSSERNKNLQIQTRYLLNAAYLRLKNIQIGYSLPSDLTREIEIERLQFYFSISNILTFTSLPKPLEPETAVVTRDPGSQSLGNPGSIGVGIVYPLQRTFSLGVNLTFK